MPNLMHATICKIKVKKHPNADRIQLGECLGHQVIVGLDVKDGDLGVYFPTDCQLSDEYCVENKLYKKDGGYFDHKRRVRAQKFRGEVSDGYWAPLESLTYTGKTFRDGEAFNVIGTHKICGKYFTAATLRQRKSQKLSKGSTLMFKKHKDTAQYRLNQDKIHGHVITTLKLHGTSGRVGRVKRELKWWERLFNIDPWHYLIGSRNIIVGHRGFRYRTALPFLNKLNKGETVYFEIVGYDNEKPIMGAVKNNEFPEYAPKVIYNYGLPVGAFENYVYRITMTNEDGHVVEYDWEAVKRRCKELNVKHVPECEEINEFDPIGLNHPQEGLVYRVENEHGVHFYKDKGFKFKVLEGIIKSSDTYIDMEEVS